MGSTLFSLHYHIVFSTKHRRPFLLNEGLPRMHSYLGGIVRGMNGVAEIVGGVADHVHLLVSLRPIHCLADVMRDLKKDSTNWAKGEINRRFGWQDGYQSVHRKSDRNCSGTEIHRQSGSSPCEAFIC